MSLIRFLPVVFLASCSCNDKGECDTDGNCVAGDCTDCADPSFASVIGDEIPGGVLLSAWSPGGEVYIVGGAFGTDQGVILKYSDGVLCVVDDDPGAALWWIHGQSADDWYAVGENGAILHSVAGIVIREDVQTSAKLFGVYDDGVDVWVVGGDINANTGEIWKKSTDTWEKVYDAPAILFKVWNNWFVGDGGQVLYWNGTEFEDRAPSDERFLTVRGASGDDVWVVGGLQTPVMWHYDNGTWTDHAIEPICGSQALMGVWTDVGEDVWVSGIAGTTAVFDGENWTCADFPISSADFHAVWKEGDDVVYVGGNFMGSAPYVGTVATLGKGDLQAVEACD
jgi:hypothetical protein